MGQIAECLELGHEGIEVYLLLLDCRIGPTLEVGRDGAGLLVSRQPVLGGHLLVEMSPQFGQVDLHKKSHDGSFRWLTIVPKYYYNTQFI